MKKILLAFVAALTLISCNREPEMTSQIVDLDIQQKHWNYTNYNDNNCFYATFNMPEISWGVYDNAMIHVYREYNTGKDDATQTILPYVRHKEYFYDVPDGDGISTYVGFFTETVDYEFTQGKLTIFYTASDFDYELDESFVPDPMHFRVVIMYKNAR